MPKDLLQIPTLYTASITLGNDTWQLSLYNEYLPHFQTADGLWGPSFLAQIARYASGTNQNDFRIQLSIKTVPFLVGFRFETRHILIASPRLQRELFLLAHP